MEVVRSPAEHGLLSPETTEPRKEEGPISRVGRLGLAVGLFVGNGRDGSEAPSGAAKGEGECLGFLRGLRRSKTVLREAMAIARELRPERSGLVATEGRRKEDAIFPSLLRAGIYEYGKGFWWEGERPQLFVCGRKRVEAEPEAGWDEMFV